MPRHSNRARQLFESARAQRRASVDWVRNYGVLKALSSRFYIARADWRRGARLAALQSLEIPRPKRAKSLSKTRLELAIREAARG